jgi:hypothetical protein
MACTGTRENLILNCGYGEGLSVLEVLDAVDRANGAPVKRVLEGRRAGDPQLVASNQRLLTRWTGVRPMPTSTGSSPTRLYGNESSAPRQAEPFRGFVYGSFAKPMRCCGGMSSS